MARNLFGGSSDDYAVDPNGRSLPNRRIRFYTSAAMTTEITDLASDAAGTGTPLTVMTDGHGFWGPVYGPDAATVMYAGAVDGAGNPPTYVVAVDTRTPASGGVTRFNTRQGDVTLSKADVTNTGLTAADIGADATGAAATVQTNLTTEITRAQAAEAALGGGMQFRTAVVVATTNQALTGLPTVDGVTMTGGQVILLTAQSTGSQNGLWAVASGAWARPANFAAGLNATATSVLVEAGTTGAGTTYAVTGTTNNVVGTNVLTFVKTSGNAASVVYPNGSGTATVVDRPLPTVSVKNFGAKGDALNRLDGVTNGTITFTAPGAAFVSGDVGKTIIIYHALDGSNDLVTTIAAVNSSTSVTLGTAAGTTASARPFTYGTDDTAAITSALTAAGATNATVYFPTGRYLDTLTRNFDLSTNLTIRGDGAMQWTRDNLVVDPPSQWIYIGTGTSTQSFLSARGSVSFRMEGLAVRHANSNFLGILLNLAGNTTRHTFQTALRHCVFDNPWGMFVAAAGLDLRGMVVANITDCTFQYVAKAVQLVTGANTFSNAVTFTRCVIDACAYAYDTVSTACLPTQLVFRDCTFETQPYGNAPVNFRFHTGDGILFSGCGFWDGQSTNPWITLVSTVNGLTVDGGVVTTCTAFIDPGSATVTGLLIRGVRFLNTGAGYSVLATSSGIVKNVVAAGNSFDTGITDNTRTSANVLAEGIIGRAIIGVGGAANVTFSSIPQAFENLRVEMLVRSDNASGNTSLKVQFNGDTAAHYWDAALYGGGGAAAADEALGQTAGRVLKYMPAASATSGDFAAASLRINGYARTVANKIVQTLGGHIQAASSGNIVPETVTTTWSSNAAITSMVLFPTAGNFAQGTVITLYGEN